MLETTTQLNPYRLWRCQSGDGSPRLAQAYVSEKYNQASPRADFYEFSLRPGISSGLAGYVSPVHGAADSRLAFFATGRDPFVKHKDLLDVVSNVLAEPDIMWGGELFMQQGVDGRVLVPAANMTSGYLYSNKLTNSRDFVRDVFERGVLRGYWAQEGKWYSHDEKKHFRKLDSRIDPQKLRHEFGNFLQQFFSFFESADFHSDFLRKLRSYRVEHDAVFEILSREEQILTAQEFPALFKLWMEIDSIVQMELLSDRDFCSDLFEDIDRIEGEILPELADRQSPLYAVDVVVTGQSF